MVEETVEVGDTEVTIAETNDGFEVTAVEDSKPAEYVRENVSMATHENVLPIDDSLCNVQIVDTKNNVISRVTFYDIIEDDKLRLMKVHVVEGELTVKINAERL